MMHNQPGIKAIKLLIQFATLTAITLAASMAQAAVKISYVHTDHLGTPQAMTDENQFVVWQADSIPFGNMTVYEDPDADGIITELNMRFPGQYYDEETGLHYNWQRYYDPELGRYITSDGIGLEGGNNTYIYALANPVNYYDPNGEAAIFAGEAAATILGIGGLGLGIAVTNNSSAGLLDPPSGFSPGSVSAIDILMMMSIGTNAILQGTLSSSGDGCPTCERQSIKAKTEFPNDDGENVTNIVRFADCTYLCPNLGIRHKFRVVDVDSSSAVINEIKLTNSCPKFLPESNFVNSGDFQ